MTRAPLLAALLLAGVARADDIPVEPMDDGHAVHAVDDVRAFRLGEGAFTYDWRAGAPSIRRGALVTLRVDPAFLVARQIRSPVLYAGPVPVAIVGQDAATGCVVGVLPPDVDARTEPFYYGSWQLPERVDAARGAAERRAALDAGLRPRPADEIARWSTAGSLRLPHADALRASLDAALRACVARATTR